MLSRLHALSSDLISQVLEGEMRETPSSASAQEPKDGDYPVYFGVSCAFVALHLVSRTPGMDVEHGRWSRMAEMMLRGSSQLLGLLVAGGMRRHQEASRALAKVEELRRRRAEDARANERVAAIYASREQSWIAERKVLRRRIQAVLAELRTLKSRGNEAMLDLSRRLEEAERSGAAKDAAMEEESSKRNELEEKLRSAEQALLESRERTRKAVQDHAAELWKHRTALAELVSGRRQLEAELARARKELEEMFDQKEEAAAAAAEELSLRNGRLQRDTEQKDKVLSAMMRKSKIDAAERQVLLKEVKMARAKKKQAELEAQWWRSARESSRHKRSSWAPTPPIDTIADCSQSCIAEFSMEEEEEDCRVSINLNDRPATSDIRQLQEMVREEAERYAAILEQRHRAEIEAFAEQMRLKDERLESLRWRLLRAELESKSLQCHAEGLDGNLSRFREEHIKLESLLLDKEKELKSMEQKFCFHLRHCQTPWPDAQLMARRQPKKKQRDSSDDDTEQIQLQAVITAETDQMEDHSSATIVKASSSEEQARSDNPVCTPPTDDIEEERVVRIDPGKADEDANAADRSSSSGPSLIGKETPWKMDIHALGTSYKIKRLKQQLLALEKMSAAAHPAKPQSPTDGSDEIRRQQQHRGFLLMMACLSKQVKRYQSLEERTDDLCRRMQESRRTGSRRELQGGQAKEENKTLHQFLEETFQLQRHMVATGQKLLEIQPRIASALADSEGLHESMGFNMEQFVGVVGCLSRDIQKGLEVQIARVIGDIEGTLACDGILRT